LKILILSDANSTHTQKWVKSLSLEGINIHLFSFFNPKVELIKKYKQYNVNITSADIQSNIKNLREPNVSKIKYLKSLPLLMKTIKNFNPEIIHAHYASSYGLLGALTRFKPFILSVWGSDISYFPYINIFNRWLMRFIINRASMICSTSSYMKEIIQDEYGRLDVEVISFGVDINFFKPYKNRSKIFKVGTIKSIESHNGIDCLIDAANILIKDYKKDFDFTIVGDGSLKEQMIQKVKDLELEEHIKFTGHVPHEKILKYFNSLSVFIAVSKRESFGVSVLEAASCEVPSITSNIGGLTEVNLDNKTGIVIDYNNPTKLANSILLLYEKEGFRLKLGRQARARVIKNFNWDQSVNQMIKAYRNFE